MEIGLNEVVRERVVHVLRILLANEYVFATKLNNFHWNVEGPHFGPLHALFQEHYEATLRVVDDVAERIRALGYYAPGSLHEFIALSTLRETIGGRYEDQAMLRQILHDSEVIIRHLRQDADVTQELGDMGTNNFLLNLLEVHEKRAWMIRSHLVIG